MQQWEAARVSKIWVLTAKLPFFFLKKSLNWLFQRWTQELSCLITTKRRIHRQCISTRGWLQIKKSPENGSSRDPSHRLTSSSFRVGLSELLEGPTVPLPPFPPFWLTSLLPGSWLHLAGCEDFIPGSILGGDRNSGFLESYKLLTGLSRGSSTA